MDALQTIEAPRALVLAAELPADRHPALVYLARLAPGSRRAMRQALETIARLVTGNHGHALTLDWSALRYQHTAAVRAALAAHYAPATANRALAALRGVLTEAWRLGLMGAEERARACDLQRVAGSRPLKGRAIAPGEVRALVGECQADPRPLGARDAALLGVLATCGLRRAELVALNLEDYDADSGALVVRSGKGNKHRTAYLVNGARRAVAAWLAVRGSEPGPLFYRGRKGGEVIPESMSADAVHDVLRRRCAAAGVAPCAPHDWRRTFVGELLDAGADLARVQRLAGHSDPATTARYDRRPERRLAEAAALLHFPFGDTI